MKAESPLPLIRADDLAYLYHLPFKNIDENDLDLLIAEDLRPDLSVIDDETVRALTCTYLEAGEP
jgi:hypothetical protein